VCFGLEVGEISVHEAELRVGDEFVGGSVDESEDKPSGLY